jgi:cyclopropane fatty-acyl-phospholipid synthase-like methyltransferase
MIKFTGANIVGLNNNDYQIERSLKYAKKEGIADKWSAVKGDFMQMSFPENSFDAVYAIEATVHAPSLQGVYEQIFKVLKPGGVFGVYEWLMTDNYDNDSELPVLPKPIYFKQTLTCRQTQSTERSDLESSKVMVSPTWSRCPRAWPLLRPLASSLSSTKILPTDQTPFLGTGRWPAIGNIWPASWMFSPLAG